MVRFDSLVDSLKEYDSSQSTPKLCRESVIYPGDLGGNNSSSLKEIYMNQHQLVCKVATCVEIYVGTASIHFRGVRVVAREQ